MGSGSFAALAGATTLGLLADRVVLALEAIGGVSVGPVVPTGSRGAFTKAAEFLDRALRAKEVPSGEVTWENVRSQQAYYQAVRAATAASGTDSSDAQVGYDLRGVLDEVMTALTEMKEGRVTDATAMEKVRVFFTALSDVATAEHYRMSARSVLRWGEKP